MAFVRKGKGHAWELRQSLQTPDGPRSRTLATFSTLTPQAVEHALDRAAAPLTAGQIVAAARRAGAPVAESPADRAANELLRELAAGRRPRGVIGRLLEARLAALAAGPPATSRPPPSRLPQTGPASRQPNARAALVDLLLLADALPPPRRKREPRFPRLEPVPA